MKLKLYTQDPSKLRSTLSLIVSSRKFITLTFTPDTLYVRVETDASVSQEPQIFCKFKMQALFSQVHIESLRNDVISLELNGELLLQALKHFEKANSDGLNVRLQRKDANEDGNMKGRAAYLALYYSHVNVSSNTINHTFKIPARILKTSMDETFTGPELRRIDLFTCLPNKFAATYKRLDKFRRPANNELLSIKCSRRGGGFLGFLLEEEGKYKVTISWNEGLDVRKPPEDESIELAVHDLFAARPDNDVDDNDEAEDKRITVKLKDWKLASKIVANCKTVVLLMAEEEACVLHCLLGESDDVEIMYYINAIRVRED